MLNPAVLRAYGQGGKRPTADGRTEMVAIPGDVALRQDWNDLHSFAGLVAGKHWVFGIPYWQDERAATNPVPVKVSPEETVFVAYAQRDGAVPRLMLDDHQALPLCGQAAVAWRAWPPIFDQEILFDRVDVPAGNRARAGCIPGNGSLLMAVSIYDGDSRILAAATNSLAAAAVEREAERRDEERLAVVRQAFARLPAGKVALLPDAKAGPGATFAARTGLRQKWVKLSPGDFVSGERFNAARFPVAFFLGDERYLRTVHKEGDGDEALVRYLAGGGTLVLLASGPYPLYYGDTPGAESGKPSPLLPQLGLPLTMSDIAGQARARRLPRQEILRNVPADFVCAPGDTRLRAGQASKCNAAGHYVPLMEVTDEKGNGAGDAAFYVELGAGPGKGGRVLYVWCGLSASPQGDAI